MRILYSHYLTEDEHPAVRMVSHISRELRALNHTVHVHASAGIIPHRHATASASGRDRRGLFPGVRGKLWFGKAVARNVGRVSRDTSVITDVSPDVVLARQDAYCWSVARAALNVGIPCVTYADAPVAYESRLFHDSQRWHPPRLVESIERWGLLHSRAVITVSNPSASRLAQYDVDSPIHVVHNGVDLREFQPHSDDDKNRIKASLGISTPLVIGFQGTFKPFHGMDLLRELMLRTKHHEQVTWLLIGDGPCRSDLESAVQGGGRVKFIGRQPASSVGRLLSTIDVAVAPHLEMLGDFYFCPLKILEYAASGCAVVASNQGDIPALLDSGHAGILIQGRQPDEWSKAIDQLINKPELRRRLGTNAREHVATGFTWQMTAKRIERVLLEVVNRDRSIAQEERRSIPTHAGV